MDIRIKEALYLKNLGTQYVVRAGTIGVEKKKVVYFYDNTRTCAVGFPRDFCLENPMFAVTRTITDREVSLKDVISIVDELSDPELREILTDKRKAL